MLTVGESRVAIQTATDGFYSPLPGQRDIRLLEILPGEDSDIVVTSLFTVSLDSNPTYAALSYAWGDATQRSIIECNGRSISITTSLAEALKAFRSFSAGPDAELNEFQSTIWADQICINQHDVPERNHQVSMMGSVYSSSACAFIWLGPGDEGSDWAMSFIGYLEEWEAGSPPDIGGIRFLRNLLDAGFPRLDEQTLMEVSALFSRPWFHRSWTLQEPIRAPQRMIACGSKIHFFESFINASLVCSNWSLRHPEWNDLNVFSFYILFSTMVKSPQELCLSALLRTTVDREASDPRDKVYALYGLVQGYHKVLLEISYAMSVEDVYRSTVRSCIGNEETLSILKLASEFKNTSDLPSWVPDWRDRSRSGCEPVSWYGLAKFHASSMSRPLVVPSSSNDKLILKGLILTIIEHTIKIPALGIHHATCSPESWGANAAAAGVPVRFLQGKTFETIYDLTTLMEEAPFYSDQIRDELRSTFPDSIGWDAAGRPDPIPQAVLTQYEELFISDTRGRCLFLAKDSLGLAPAPTQVGDRVCILLGGDVPFVLRPRQKPGGTTPSKEAESEHHNMPSTTSQDMPNPGHHGSLESPHAAKESLEATEWTLIGDCYLYGYMRGEAMETVTEGDYVNFTLV